MNEVNRFLNSVDALYGLSNVIRVLRIEQITEEALERIKDANTLLDEVAAVLNGEDE
jgi:hypothetical protein